MIKNLRVLKMVTYNPKRAIYISEEEHLDLINQLTPRELQLYVRLKFSLSKNWCPEDYEFDSLAKLENVSRKTIQNTFYSLRKKGYVDIAFFPDDQGIKCVKVVVGAEMVKLYNLGIAVSMEQSNELREALLDTPLDEPNLTQEEIQQRVDGINQRILNLGKKTI